ncbi:MAG: tetratricopeptide repeat protein [Thermoanaerobacteraceae bacterium]|nr:tetratricopeptide repeat protein [Thermoanaerobacteraceae bacterium]
MQRGITAWKMTVKRLLRKIPGNNRDCTGIENNKRKQGYLHLKQKEFRKPIACFKQAQEEEGSTSNFIYWIGEAYSQEGDYETGLRFLEKAVARNPGDINAQLRKAQCQIKLGNYKEATSNLVQIVSRKPGHQEALCDLGYSLIMQECYDQAIYYLSRALHRAPWDQNLYRNLALAFFKSGDVEAALQHYRRLERLVDGLSCDELNNIGVCLAEKGDYETAINYFSRALGQCEGEQSPAFTQIQLNLTIADFYLGNYHQAISQLDELYRCNPADENLLLSIADCLVKIGKDNLALNYYGKLVELNRQNVVYLERFIQCLIECGRYDEAVYQLETKVDQLVPRTSIKNLWYLLGLALDGIGEHGKAVDCYNRSLGLVE